MKTLPLGGRGLAPVAYQLRWADRTVLFSGRLPLTVQFFGQTLIKAHPAELAALQAGFQESNAKKLEYQTALDQLNQLQPDLWLPTVPTDGQNANLYDNQWKQVIAENRKLF